MINAQRWSPKLSPTSSEVSDVGGVMSVISMIVIYSNITGWSEFSLAESLANTLKKQKPVWRSACKSDISNTTAGIVLG